MTMTGRWQRGSISRSLVLLAAMAVALVISCGDDDGPTEPQGPTLELVVGDRQRGPVGEPLPDSMVVSLAQDGVGVPGETVHFAVTAGDATVAPDSAVTDSLGLAAALVTMGEEAGWVQVLVVYPTEADTLEFQFLAEAEARVVELSQDQRLELVWIEPGSFLMGALPSEPGYREEEGPQHRVTITRGFWMGKHEISQGQWEAVTNYRPWEGQQYVWEDAVYPASYVSWEDAQGFIAGLNLLAGEEAYRLPTEAEWEYACRAGTTTLWSFGDELGDLWDYAWYRDNAWYQGWELALPSGTRYPNPWGLHDMHGNLNEWVQDWQGSYSAESQVDPTGPETGTHRVVRGGDFAYEAQLTRSAFRSGAGPIGRSSIIGMRVVRSE